MIEIKNIKKIYQQGNQRVTVLNGIDLIIKKGEFIAMMGPSGSGKSTCAHIIGLLDQPTSGHYLFDHQELSGLSDDQRTIFRHKEIGFIFQNFYLLSRMSALDNVLLPLLYSHSLHEKEKAKKKGENLLKRMGLGHRLDHFPTQLSGGQQQRVAIARALIQNPRLLIADEPTGNLDTEHEKEVLKILKELHEEGMTILMITHSPHVAQQTNRIVTLKEGKIDHPETIAPIHSFSQKNNLSSFLLKEEKKQDNQQKPVFLLFKKSLVFLHQAYFILSSNKLRTALCTLGILIGATSLVITLAIGRGSRFHLEKKLSVLGSNVLYIQSRGIKKSGVNQEMGSQSRLTIEDEKELKNTFSFIEESASQIYRRSQVTFSNKNWNTAIQGVSFSYPLVWDIKILRGKFFSQEENEKKKRVAILGLRVVRELFSSSQNPLGEFIKIDKVPFQVIGILPEKGSFQFNDQDDRIIIPIFTAMYRLFGVLFNDAISLKINPSFEIKNIENILKEKLFSYKKIPFSQQKDAFFILNTKEMKKTLSQTTETMTMLLYSFSSLSLLVGGIGIMNIILFSITERTQEIGLRKAIGARKKDILYQFLTESFLISSLGGLGGVFLGCLGSYLFSVFSQIPIFIYFDSLSLAFLFSFIMGMIFSLYPAYQASIKNPIEALRAE